MYVSNIIKQKEIEKWQKGDNILIKSQTGTGKSHFIMNTLSCYYEKNNLKTLIFSNRDLLKQQNKRNALRNVECINYQFIEQLDPEKLEEKLAHYDVINFDECHYFFKDASFNYNTEKILKYALKQTNQIKIFSSATPEPLFYTGIKFAYQYDIPKNYSFIEKIIFYDDIADILDEIIQSENKSLCFFSNATKACKFALAHSNDAQFYCSKGNSLWRVADKDIALDIVINYTFSKKVLATTTVLENGVTIIDSALKNIVIDFYDPITILQTLGRKRIQSKDKITLYLRVPTRYDIQRKAYLKSGSDSLAAQLYVEFLKDHFKEIRKVGYIFYWCNYFKFSVQNVDYRNKYGEIREFMKANCNKCVTKEKLEELFGKFMPIKQDARLVTYNNFMKKSLLDYKLVSKRVSSEKARNRKIFVEKIKKEVDG